MWGSEGHIKFLSINAFPYIAKEHRSSFLMLLSKELVMSIQRVVDARGSFCPGPLMELISNMKMMAVGDVLELLSTDAGSAADVPEWIKKVGHTMINTEQDAEGTWHIRVRKEK